MDVNDSINEFIAIMTPAIYGDDGVGETAKQSNAIMTNMVDELNELGFFEAPASLNHHGNETGYLFKHSAQVTKNLLTLTNKLDLKWSRPASPYFVGMFHDLCKCDNYKHPTFVIEVQKDKWEYNNASILTGHGDKSVIMALKLFGNLKMGTLTEEEIACIRWHMGAFDNKENWNHYGHAVTLYPNVLWTHTADMMAARIDGV